MPLYDYRCQACGHSFELLVFASTVPACTTCQSTDVQRQVSLPARQGTSAGIIAAGRRAAAREGHFSNYSRRERVKVK